jgi:hypothetical protein
MRAIQIRFLPATNFQGARMKAFIEGNSITLPFQYEISDEESRAHQMALELITKLNWTNIEINGIGQLPNGDYAATLKSKY